MIDVATRCAYFARMAKDTFMKVRVTKDEQAEWMRICAAAGRDFSSIVRDTMKRRAAALKREQSKETKQ